MTLDELKKHLETYGFRVAENHLRYRENPCDWYAWRNTIGRDCESNEKAPALAVYPSVYYDMVTVECSITGEQRGVWFKLMAYAFTAEEFVDHLGEIEFRLTDAWNALGD